MSELSNIEAEQSLLGALLIRNDAFIHIGSLLASHFYEPLHQRIFTSMCKRFERGEKFDALLLKSEFEGDELLQDLGAGKYLTNLVAFTTATNISDIGKILIELSQRRALLETINKASDEIMDLSCNTPAEIALGISTKLSDAISGYDAPMFYDDVQVTDSIMSELLRDVQPYKTGYYGLDEAMGGGLYPGKSYGFAARKKVGKTILAGSISCNLNMAGVKHLFICGEMSPQEIQKRTLARLLKIKQSVFNSRYSKSQEFLERVEKIKSESKRAMIFKNAPGLTFEELKRYVLLARMQKKITGFILDYWQLVGGKPKNKSTAEHLDEVAQWIADTCRRYDLWSIVMAQINQEGNTRGGEGIRLAFDQVYVMQAPEGDAGRSERWLEMSDTRYTPWRSVGSENNPGMYLCERGPYLSETYDDGIDL